MELSNSFFYVYLINFSVTLLDLNEYCAHLKHVYNFNVEIIMMSVSYSLARQKVCIFFTKIIDLMQCFQCKSDQGANHQLSESHSVTGQFGSCPAFERLNIEP